jgi:hypothetical protein
MAAHRTVAARAIAIIHKSGLAGLQTCGSRPLGNTDTEIYRVLGGHIGLMARSGAEKQTWPHTDRWLEEAQRDYMYTPPLMLICCPVM